MYLCSVTVYRAVVFCEVPIVLRYVCVHVCVCACVYVSVVYSAFCADASKCDFIWTSKCLVLLLCFNVVKCCSGTF